MRAARLHEHTDAIGSALSIEDVDRPAVTAAEDVLVEVEGAGLCSTDNEITKGEGPEVRLPLTPGHETAGTVVEVPGMTRDGRFAEYLLTAERAVVPLEEIDAAAAALHDGEVTGRVVIRP